MMWPMCLQCGGMSFHTHTQDPPPPPPSSCLMCPASTRRLDVHHVPSFHAAAHVLNSRAYLQRMETKDLARMACAFGAAGVCVERLLTGIAEVGRGWGCTGALMCGARAHSPSLGACVAEDCCRGSLQRIVTEGCCRGSMLWATPLGRSLNTFLLPPPLLNPNPWPFASPLLALCRL